MVAKINRKRVFLPKLKGRRDLMQVSDKEPSLLLTKSDGSKNISQLLYPISSALSDVEQIKTVFQLIVS